MFHRPIEASLSHIAVLGNALPRRCGLATYTSHSVAALRAEYPRLSVDHYAMDDGHEVSYGPDVAMTIAADDVSAYVRAAAAISRSGAQLLWIHHEFGIFGGPAGEHLLAVLRHLDIPVVITLHTVLPNPSPDQRRVMNALVAKADQLIVMAQEAARLLRTVYEADPARVEVIPHGAPDRPLVETRLLKERLGLGTGPIVMTFGLLSPGKGIEHAIRALPGVVARHPDLTYLIVGATHPALVREQGEAYRESLIELARHLGVEGHVTFVDRFLEDDALLDFLQASDVYLTPYLSREQVTSGTLSYALALGRPVVATPYVHAEEALAGGVGTLVPFADSAAITAALLELLDDPARLAAQALKVWRASRPTIWQQNARAVMDVFSDAVSGRPVSLPDRRTCDPARVQLTGIAAMTDAVGIIQHSIHGVPDRRHGYCIDDNARALKLVCATRAGDPAERARLAVVYAAFVEHGWNEDARRFRNFMGYDRRWLEESGSEDSNGRTLWALGEVMRTAPRDAIRRWATGLFNKAAPIASTLSSPRAIAFAMLGLVGALKAEPNHPFAAELLRRGLDRLQQILADARQADLPWFESVLSYDNARLPQAMIEAGHLLGNADAVTSGLETLRWLLKRQTGPNGFFRPVATESFGQPLDSAAIFDQQPLEATATIEACVTAYRSQPDQTWIDAANAAFSWFEGQNDLGLPLISEDEGYCYDGLTSQGVNLNLGAESVLALQMARQAMAELAGKSELVPQLLVV